MRGGTYRALAPQLRALPPSAPLPSLPTPCQRGEGRPPPCPAAFERHALGSRPPPSARSPLYALWDVALWCGVGKVDVKDIMKKVDVKDSMKSTGKR